MIDFKPADLDTVLRILAEHVPTCEVRAFGSRATWTAKDYSDLDLVVIGEEPVPSLTMGRLREAFEDSDLPICVDVLDWHTISDTWKEQINENSEVVQKRPLPDEWREVTFGDCASLVRDSVSPADFGVTPYIGLEHIGQESLFLVGSGVASDVSSTKSRFKIGDILFGKLRPYFRKVIQAKFDGICSTDIWVVRPTQDVDARFLFYLMASRWFVGAATRSSEGTRMPRAQWDFVSRLPMRLPPLDEQRRIAGVLGALDDRIELNRRMSETLEEMARALFQSWFVNFDPVHAKAEGRPSGLPPELDALFPDTFQDSELGPIPQGWQVQELGDDFRITMGQSPPGDTYNEDGDGLPFFQGRTDFGFRFPKQRVYCSAPKRLADPGDSLISVRAPVGDLNMAMEGCCIGRGVAAVRHVSGSCSYTYYAMNSLHDTLQKYEAEGTVFGSINKRDFHSISWISPFGSCVEAFERICSTVEDQIRINELTCASLVAQRDALLPRLVSGKLRVPAYEFSGEELLVGANIGEIAL